MERRNAVGGIHRLEAKQTKRHACQMPAPANVSSRSSCRAGEASQLLQEKTPVTRAIALWCHLYDVGRYGRSPLVEA